MKTVRKIVNIDTEKCNGCGECVEVCAEGAIELVNGKARLVAENYCDGLAACLGKCPQNAISIIKREAEAFDHEAAELHLADSDSGATLPCGCPSIELQMFQASCGCSNESRTWGPIPSALTHWPVQIKLISPIAPFLKNADLLVASDCTPLAYPNFHTDFLKGKVVMVGCPKFDDSKEYIKKFADIFRAANIRSITIVFMEVPCCSKMPLIVQKGMEIAGKEIPTEIVVISTRGTILQQRPLTV